MYKPPLTNHQSPNSVDKMSSQKIPGHSFQSDNPYQAPTAPLDTVESSGTRYAGFWRRFVAAAIDGLLMLLLLAPLSITIVGRQEAEVAAISFSFSSILVEYLLPMVITLLFWFFYSATPGKMLLGLKIIDAQHGGKPKPFQLLMRYIGYFPSMVVLFMGFIWIAIDEKKQGWHDKVAETLVVRK